MSVSLTWLADGYGGKRAFVRHLAARFEVALGRHRQFIGKDIRDPSRLFFVCKGNICRSPFAEQLARGLGIDACSAGLEADAGRRADARAIVVAQRHGVDLAQHRSRRLHALDVKEGDVVVAFEPEHAWKLRSHLPRGTPIVLLGMFGRLPCAYLHDPYGLSEGYFDACFARIGEALRALQARAIPPPSESRA